MGTRLSKESEGLLLQYIRLISKMFGDGQTEGRVSRDLPRAWASSNIRRRVLPRAVEPPLTHVRYQISAKYAENTFKIRGLQASHTSSPAFNFRVLLTIEWSSGDRLGYAWEAILLFKSQVCKFASTRVTCSCVLSVTMSNLNSSWVRLTVVDSSSQARDAFRKPGSWDLGTIRHSRIWSRTRGSELWWTAKGSLRLKI